MPIYSYVCDTCKLAKDEFQFMAHPAFTQCPTCGADTYHRVPTLPHTDLKEFHTPIEMFSVAMDNDAEIRAFKASCPDVDVETDPRSESYGIPIARNRKQKLQALSAAGFIETNSERVR